MVRDREKIMKYNYEVIKEEVARLARVDTFPELKGKTILITGANGLIGGFLADFLCYLNDVCGYKINLLLTSYSPVGKATRVSHLTCRPDVTYFSWDCSLPFEENEIKDVDIIVFSSGYGQPSKFLENKIKTTMINIIGVRSLIDHFRRKQKSKIKFLFLSTSEVYGSPDEYPTTEEFSGRLDMSNNRACYIVSKLAGEVLCKEYNDSSEVEAKSARVALTYGPGTSRADTRVLQEFVFKAAHDRKIKMFDEGRSIRNYLYITDCCEILLKILLRGTRNVYNVGGDTEEVSIHNLSEKIADNFKVPVEKGSNNSSATSNAPNKVGLSMNRFRDEFPSYGPNIVNLETGIKQTLRWYNLHD